MCVSYSRIRTAPSDMAMCLQFTLANINKSPAVVAYEKLNFLNKLHIGRRLADPEERDKLVARLKPALERDYDG